MKTKASSRKISNNKRRQLNQIAQQALLHINDGKILAAATLCDKADDIFKNFPEIMYARGMIAAFQEDYPTSCKWLEPACAAMPKRFDCLANLASSMSLCDRKEETAAIFPRIMEKAPDLFERMNGHAVFGDLLIDLGEYQQAMKLLGQAVARTNSKDADTAIKASGLYNEFGKPDVAVSLLEKAQTTAPTDPRIPYEIATILIKQNRNEEARALLKKALAIKPGFIDALFLLIKTGPYQGMEDDLAKMREIYRQAPPESSHRILPAFALGDAEDKEGHYPEAFDYWSEGNRIHRNHTGYNEQDQESIHQAAIEAFPAPRFLHETSENCSSASPIFIVGMPRCGSTLLERALSRHPMLTDAGEIDALGQSIAGRMRLRSNQLVIENLKTLDDEALLGVGREYIRRIRNEYQVEGTAVDKSLGNYLFIGAIAKALPNAHIIHIQREPMASCLSMFQANFDNVHYSFNLDELGRQYARYQKLMQHWRNVLPQGVMFETSYENLVSNTEAELRRILEYCGLEWHPDCLATHKATGSVNTASLFQVRQPIHQKSVARWKHYEEQLAPLRKYIKASSNS
ncbi:Tetratricopeptide repeat-containing protein [Mariprofundus ferrinatatus]|uniref:Tetratricopeptide repeat-containing protein n=1 Tax=Mariprofundus ferrinatatus TaxID=1921087 RepID=A0A2K8L7B2_9PROT|nr:sulfotransferase [Mariprofundus ferrinatatus]ATX83022.1 Tetratricopeptide repeat-containing protein [Mariprofundus ferrinatatus]